VKNAIKKLWPKINPYRGEFFIALRFGIYASLIKAAAPELVKQLMVAWEKKDYMPAVYLPVLIAVVWIATSATRYFHSFKMKFVADKIGVEMRETLMKKYLSLNLSYLQSFERGSGGLISRMLNDISAIHNGIHKVADIFREPIMVVMMLGYLLYLDWSYTIFVLIAVPIVGAVLRKLTKGLRKYSHRNQEVMEEFTKTLKESLDGTRIVQSFGLQDVMSKRFHEQANKYLETRREILSREESAGPISESITMVFVCVLLLYTTYKVFHDDFTFPDFTGFLLAMGVLQDSIRKLQDAYIRIQQGAVALDRLHDVLDSQPSLQDDPNPVPFPKDWKTIEFRNVSFAFRDELVLKNVSMTIGRSETIAFVGSSGSGKSTLVNLLQRFFDSTSGQILIGGVDIKKIRLAELRQNIALVTQDVFLFSDSIEKNILMGNRNATTAEVEKAAKMANAHNFIEKAPEKYKTLVGDFGGRISGGEKQRISIARAFLKDAPILVLDEATSALDSESEAEVQKGLVQLMQGRTAFVIAHRLSTVSAATKIFVLKKGELIESGTHDDLMKRGGEYRSFYDLQSSNW
jgi:subfamily B ATP-binding cassette protein MsbA